MNLRISFLPVLILCLLTATPQSHAAPFSLAGVTISFPDAWESVTPTSSMRQGQWRIAPLKSGQDAGEMTAFYFGAGQGGDVQSNIDRWLRSLTQPDGSPIEGKTTTRKVNGLAITQVEGFGTFASGMPGQPATPKASYGLLGAIIEGPQGRVFFKLTGPAPLIESQRQAFTKAFDSAKP
jgi:hypothetical protein